MLLVSCNSGYSNLRSTQGFEGSGYENISDEDGANSADMSADEGMDQLPGDDQKSDADYSDDGAADDVPPPPVVEENESAEVSYSEETIPVIHSNDKIFMMPKKATVCGEELTLVGKGVREDHGDRYVIGLYYPEMTCNTRTLVDSKVNKLLVFNFVKESDAGDVEDRIKKAINNSKPEKEDITEELQAEIDKTIKYFKEKVKNGDKSEIVHSPDLGMNANLSGKESDLSSTSEMNKILWSAFLEEPKRGSDNIGKVRKQIYEYCEAQ